ncbi:MAG: hypothetical protein U1E17_02915 [Geminicoccaceae bacterium]
MISGTVHDLVRGKLTRCADALGPQQVKNLAEPVPAFRVTAALPQPEAVPRSADPGPRRPVRRRLDPLSCAPRAAMIGLFLLAVNLIASPHGLVLLAVLGMTLHLGLLWTRRP